MLSSITLLVTLLIVVLLNVVSSKPVSEKLQTPTPSASAISAEEIAAKAKAQAEEQAAFDKTPAGKMCKQHPGWSRDDCQRVVNKTYWIGMSYDMLVTEIGKPDSANPSNYGSGVHWQWCWYDIKPSCFYDSDGDKLIDSYN